MRHPVVELHGPEHHFLVPSALLAAFSNVRGDGDRRAERVAEARHRSEPIGGGEPAQAGFAVGRARAGRGSEPGPSSPSRRDRRRSAGPSVGSRTA
jgi:hypothetical protein